MDAFTLTNENTRKILTFSKINFVFGYSGSGKTTFLENINLALTGKDKTWICNGCKILPNDFNVIYISGKEDISSHLKLSSKSLLQKLILKNKYSPIFNDSLRSISQNLESVRSEIESDLSAVLNGVRVSIKDQDDPLDFVVDNLSVSCEGASTSGERLQLFELVAALTRLTESKTVVLIDDFGNDFDEETILSYVKQAREQNACFVFACNKPLPQWILDGDISVFAIRNGETTPLPNIESLVMDAIDGQPQYQSFEEYMLGRGYSQLSGIAETYVKMIREDRLANLLRILTSKNPKISDSYGIDSISIVPKSKEEETIYRKIFDLLGIK